MSSKTPVADQDGCEWVNVSSDGIVSAQPGSRAPRPVERPCVYVVLCSLVARVEQSVRSALVCLSTVEDTTCCTKARLT